MINDKQLWILIQDQLPEYLRHDSNYDKLVAFLQAYHAFLQDYQSNNPVEVISNTGSYLDVDTTVDLFIQHFQSQYLEDMPQIYNPNETDPTKKAHERAQFSRVVKNINDFYVSKSTEDAYRALFRILYNEEINVFYPKTVILKTSDGHWIEDVSIKIHVTSGDITAFNLTYGSAQAVEFTVLEDTGAKATVERITATQGPFYIIYELFFTKATILNPTQSYSSSHGNPPAFDVGNMVRVTLGSQVVEGEILTGLTYYPGRYDGVKGFLSDQTKLRGPLPSKLFPEGHIPADYYQEFSYVIKSAVPISTWGDVIKKILHPAGFAVFGEVILSPESDTGVDIVGMYHSNRDDVNTKYSGGGYLYYLLILLLIEFGVVPTRTVAESTISPMMFLVPDNVLGRSFNSLQKFIFTYPSYAGGNQPYGGTIPASNTALPSAFDVPAWDSNSVGNTPIRIFADLHISDFSSDVARTKRTDICIEPFLLLEAYP